VGNYAPGRPLPEVDEVEEETAPPVFPPSPPPPREYFSARPGPRGPEGPVRGAHGAFGFFFPPFFPKLFSDTPTSSDSSRPDPEGFGRLFPPFPPFPHAIGKGGKMPPAFATGGLCKPFGDPANVLLLFPSPPPFAKIPDTKHQKDGTWAAAIRKTARYPLSFPPLFFSFPFSRHVSRFMLRFLGVAPSNSFPKHRVFFFFFFFFFPRFPNFFLFFPFPSFPVSKGWVDNLRPWPMHLMANAGELPAPQRSAPPDSLFFFFFFLFPPSFSLPAAGSQWAPAHGVSRRARRSRKNEAIGRGVFSSFSSFPPLPPASMAGTVGRSVVPTRRPVARGRIGLAPTFLFFFFFSPPETINVAATQVSPGFFGLRHSLVGCPFPPFSFFSFFLCARRRVRGGYRSVRRPPIPHFAWLVVSLSFSPPFLFTRGWGRACAAGAKQLRRSFFFFLFFFSPPFLFLSPDHTGRNRKR